MYPWNKRAVLTELIIEIFRLNGRLLAVGDALVADIGLTSARWQVVGPIAQSPVPIARRAYRPQHGVDPPGRAASGERAGRRRVGALRPNPHHQRAKLVLLTARGKAAYDAAMKRQGPWASRLAEGLSATDIERAAATLRALRQRLDDRAESGDDDAQADLSYCRRDRPLDHPHLLALDQGRGALRLRRDGDAGEAGDPVGP